MNQTIRVRGILAKRHAAIRPHRLGVWYSGWYNGLAKKSSINVPRVRENIHQVIVYCKANRQVTVIKAIDAVLKSQKNSGN